MAPLDRPSQVVPDGGEVVGVPSAVATSQTVAGGLVMGLLRFGVPLSLLADLSSGSGPDSVGIFRAELVRVADSSQDVDPSPGGVPGWVGLPSSDGGVGFCGTVGRPPA
jgi:hypothetical protein